MDTPIPPFQHAGRWLEELESPETASDALGRTTFVYALTDALVRLPTDRSVVTAVYGPWGCGKTWLLEQVIRRLDDEYGSEMITCRFSPWELKSGDQILAEFFVTISAKIPRNDSSVEVIPLWKKLQQLTTIGAIGSAAIISSLAVSGGLHGEALKSAEAIAPMLQSLTLLFGQANESTSTKPQQEPQTLREVKDELANKLKEKLRRPILVVIDDLDRLTHPEIQLMIRLLNTTANLPKIHYLIFGDREQIASALDPVCGDQGDRYLEKIVQNSFQVPEPAESQIELRLRDGLYKIAIASNESPDAHSERFAKLWQLTLKFRIRNFRDCHRLLRTCAFHATSLTRNDTLEVDLIDLLGIDFLRVFEPSLYHLVATNPPTDDWCMINSLTSDETKEPDTISKFCSKSSLERLTTIHFLLFLFPPLWNHAGKFLSNEGIYMHRRDPDSGLRIHHANKTPIYFQLDIPSGQLPEAKFREIIKAGDNQKVNSELLHQYQSNGWIPQLLSRIIADFSLISLESLISILHSVSSFSDHLRQSDDRPGNELLLANDFMDILLDKHKNPTKVLSILGNQEGISLQLSLLEQLRNIAGCTFGPGIRGSHKLPRLPESEIEHFCDALLEVTKKRFSDGTFIRERHEVFRAYRMANALGQRRCQSILEASLSPNSTNSPWNVIESIGYSSISRFSPEVWDTVTKENEVGHHLLEEILKFASKRFWKKFTNSQNPPASFHITTLIFPHLKSALRFSSSTNPSQRS